MKLFDFVLARDGAVELKSIAQPTLTFDSLGHVFETALQHEQKVTVQINQQQEELIDRLVAEGELGADRAAVLRHGLLELCRQHFDIPTRIEGRSGHRRASVGGAARR